MPAPAAPTSGFKPPAAMPDPTAADDPFDRVMTPKEIFDVICEELDLEPDVYAMIPELGHFEAGGAKWERGKPVPDRDDLVVFFIGGGKDGDRSGDHVAGDIRAYVRPASVMDPKLPMWRLYTFNRAIFGGSVMVTMPQASWVQLITFEKRAAALILELIEDDEKITDEDLVEAGEVERERCVEWLKANALDNPAARMVVALEAEDKAAEEAGDDEDDEEEEDE